MRINGLRNMKPAMARAIARMVSRHDFKLCIVDPSEYMRRFNIGALATQAQTTLRWHRAARGRG